MPFSDGVIDTLDYAVVLRAISEEPEFEQIRKIADLNGDGLVLVDDIGELKTNIGKQKQIIEWSNIWKQKKYWWLMMNPE